MFLRLRSLQYPVSVAVTAIFAVWAFAAEGVRFNEPDFGRWLPDLLVGSAWAGTGLLVLRRTPVHRSGGLMIAFGATWFVGNFAGTAVPFLGVLASHGTYLHRGVLAHVILAFPTGRITGRLTAAVVVLAYAGSLVSPLAQSPAASTAMAAMVALVAGFRCRRTLGPTRRSRSAALVSAMLMLLVVAASALIHLVLPLRGQAALHAYELVLVLVAATLARAAVRLNRNVSGVADLVVDLADGPPSEVGAALALALGDPTARVGYWVASDNHFVDVDGNEFRSGAQAGRALSIVRSQDGPLLALDHDASLVGGLDLTGPLEEAASLMIANARLQADLRTRIRDVAAARRRLVEAESQERRALEQQLQEGALRDLDALRSTLEAAREVASETVARELVAAMVQLQQSKEEMKRLSKGLYPSALTQGRLGPALRDLASQLPLTVEVGSVDEVLPPAVLELVYFVCAEAVANVVKHASATMLSIMVSRDDGRLAVVVCDDGVGGATASGGIGLRGMADRVEAYGGTLFLDSPQAGGTRLAVEVPLDGQSGTFKEADAVSRPSPIGGP